MTTNLKFHNDEVKGQTFHGLALKSFRSECSVFENCIFEEISCDDVCFGGGRSPSVYRKCTFRNVRFKSSVPGVATFKSCIFERINFQNMFFVDAEFLDCSFDGTVKKGNFVGRSDSDVGRGNRFRGNDLSKLELIDFGLVGIDLSSQILPRGSNLVTIYDVSGLVGAMKKKYSGELSENILRLLDIFEFEAGSHNQLHFDKTEVPPKLRDASDALFAIIREESAFQKYLTQSRWRKLWT